MPPELLRCELNLEVWRGALAVRWALVEQSRAESGRGSNPLRPLGKEQWSP